jgi:hypothetical protein
MKRLLISLSACLFLINLSFAQDVKDKKSTNDDMYGGKSQGKSKNKTKNQDNYDPDKYESSKVRRSDKSTEKKDGVYGYSQSEVDEHKNPTWMPGETNTARNVDTSIINKYYRMRNTVVMVNLYKVDSSSIIWHDYKVERKHARQQYRLQKKAIRRSNRGYYNGYNPGYGYGYGGGLRPSFNLGFGWNSRRGWGLNPGIGFGFGSGLGYGGYNQGYYGNYGYGYNPGYYNNYGYNPYCGYNSGYGWGGNQIITGGTSNNNNSGNNNPRPSSPLRYR